MRSGFVALAAVVLVALGGNWEVEELPARGGSCSITADSAAQPHIAFAAAAGWGYAVRTDDSWAIVYPQTEQPVPGLELCLDAGGLPHVGFIEGRHTPPYHHSVRYARFDGDTWHFETVTGPGHYVRLSLALARDNTPHMKFYDVDSAAVRYARRAGDTWNILTVPTEHPDTLRSTGCGTLTLDTSDRPALAIDWGKRECAPRGLDSIWLAVFEYDGQSWHRFEADSSQGWGVYDFWQPRIRCDPATNLFHITHRAGRYITGRGHDWQAEWTGISVGNRVYDFALHRGRPHIACSHRLLHQWRGAGGWEEEPVVGGDTIAWEVSITVDDTGLPQVAFVTPDGNLFYARRRFVGTQEPAPTQPAPAAGTPTIVRGRLSLPRMTNDQFPMTLLDASGRKVMELVPGENDVRHLSPGVYFIRTEGPRGQGVEGTSVRKVVIQR